MGLPDGREGFVVVILTCLFTPFDMSFVDYAVSKVIWSSMARPEVSISTCLVPFCMCLLMKVYLVTCHWISSIFNGYRSWMKVVFYSKKCIHCINQSVLSLSAMDFTVVKNSLNSFTGPKIKWS